MQVTLEQSPTRASVFAPEILNGLHHGKINLEVGGSASIPLHACFTCPGALWKVAGKPAVAWCWVSSTRRIAEVGLHVFPTYMPEPRNSL